MSHVKGTPSTSQIQYYGYHSRPNGRDYRFGHGPWRGFLSTMLPGKATHAYPTNDSLGLDL